MKLSATHRAIAGSTGYQPNGLLGLLGGGAPTEVCADYFREYGGRLEDLITTVYLVRTRLVAQLDEHREMAQIIFSRFGFDTLTGKRNVFKPLVSTLRRTSRLNGATGAVINAAYKLRLALDNYNKSSYYLITNELVRLNLLPVDEIGVSNPVTPLEQEETLEEFAINSVHDYVIDNRDRIIKWLEKTDNERWRYTRQVTGYHNEAIDLLKRIASDILPVVYTPDYKSPTPRPKP